MNSHWPMNQHFLLIMFKIKIDDKKNFKNTKIENLKIKRNIISIKQGSVLFLSIFNFYADYWTF